MNGKSAKKLRRAFGTGKAYREAKRSVDTFPTSMAQRPKLVVQRAPKSDRKPAAPGWPSTENQKQQSRPLIVLGPRTRTSPAKLLQLQGKKNETTFRQAYGMAPKHLLDKLALEHPRVVV